MAERVEARRAGETVPASDSDLEQGDYRLDGTLREQEEFMLKEIAAKFGITPEASHVARPLSRAPPHLEQLAQDGKGPRRLCRHVP